VKRSLLALAAAVLATSLRAQEASRPDATLPDLPADAGLSLPGLDPTQSRALVEALRAGAYARAEELLVEAGQGEDASPELLRLLGGVSFRIGNHLGAAIALKKAEAKAPLDETSRFTLAMAYVVMGRREWARPELRKLAAAAPDNALYPYWIARLDYDTGLHAAAAQGFEQAITLDPSFVKAYDNLGLCQEALGRYDAAVASHQKATEINRASKPPSPWPPHNLGLLLTRLGRAGDAEPLFREALRHGPGFAPAHYQLGVLLEKAGRADEAVAALTEAARLDSRLPDPHYALARIHRRQGRVADADHALETFQRLRSENKRAGPTPMR
jgi:tetratricopeptide (TPR) repeat protein